MNLKLNQGLPPFIKYGGGSRKGIGSLVPAPMVTTRLLGNYHTCLVFPYQQLSSGKKPVVTERKIDSVVYMYRIRFVIAKLET